MGNLAQLYTNKPLKTIEKPLLPGHLVLGLGVIPTEVRQLSRAVEESFRGQQEDFSTALVPHFGRNDTLLGYLSEN